MLKTFTEKHLRGHWSCIEESKIRLKLVRFWRAQVVDGKCDVPRVRMRLRTLMGSCLQLKHYQMVPIAFPEG